MTSPYHKSTSLPLVVIGSAMAGAALYVGVQKVIMFSRKPPKDAETDPSIATEIVWKCIGGALSAAQLHVGDELNLYNVLRECCYDSKDASVTAITLASRTGFHQRWLREWLAHQAALGILQLLPGTKDDDSALHYRLPRATSDVLANPSSPHYNIAMVSLVPSLVQRAHTMLPSAFRTGWDVRMMSLLLLLRSIDSMPCIFEMFFSLAWCRLCWTDASIGY